MPAYVDLAVKLQRDGFGVAIQVVHVHSAVGCAAGEPLGVGVEAEVGDGGTMGVDAVDLGGQ